MKTSPIPTIVLFLVVFALAPATVRADVITNWSYSVNSAFVSWLAPDSKGNIVWKDAETHQNRVGSRTAGDSLYDSQYGVDTILEWSSFNSNANNSSGVAGIRSSSLELHSQQGTIQTDGSLQTALTMVHNNQTIGNNAPKPKIMDITVDVLLTGRHEDGTQISQDISLNLTLGFIETANSGYGMKYTEDDIFFVIDMANTTKRFTDAEGNIYDASLDAVFEELTGSHLNAAAYYIDKEFGNYYSYDSGQALYGWSTLENTYEQNQMNVNIVVRHDTMPTTPEPSTMLVFGLAGLAGLPVFRRMRRGH